MCLSRADKIEYYLQRLTDEYGTDAVSEFLFDTSECCYPDRTMFCPVCSNGCFKRSVLSDLDKDDAKKVLHDMFRVRYLENKGEFD